MPRGPLVTAGTGVAVLGVGVLAFALSTSTPADPPVARTVAAAPTSAPPSPAPVDQSPSHPGPSARKSQSLSALPSASDRVAWIEVGAVGIHTAVTPRGLSSSGTISPPRGTVMWFTESGRVMPGLVGTSVVAGHVAYDDVPDVFSTLPELRTGEKVRVGYEDGDVLVLTVTRTGIVDKKGLQTDQDVWGANSTTRRVVLITCDDALGFRSDGHRVANFVAVAEA
jgi:hypothetical protein